MTTAYAPGCDKFHQVLLLHSLGLGAKTVVRFRIRHDLLFVMWCNKILFTLGFTWEMNLGTLAESPVFD